MPRLVTFGDSATFGHGLVDCHIEPNKPGPNPSKLAWPSLLANMLGVEVVNCSNPGASNIHILWKLLNFDFKDDDLCVVMWTFFGRHPFSKLKYDSSNIDWDNYESAVVKNLPEIGREDIVIRNFINIHHGYLHLLNKNIKQLFIIGPSGELLYKIPDIKIPTLITDITIKKSLVDLALDGMHPGPKTHMNIAKELLDKINVIH
jgi:lysophospholipase L1-like esterase